MSTKADVYKDYFLPEFPDYVVIDTTYTCNVVCGMCHLSSKDFKVPANPHVSVGLIERMIPLLKKTRSVFFLGRGEPLMHPRIYDILSLVRSHCPDIHITFTTNGLLLTKRNISKLLDAQVDQINVSLDGPDIARGHPQFEKAKANIRELALQKANREVEYPAIHFGYVIGKDNELALRPTLEFGIEVGIHGISIEPLRILEPNPDWDDYVRENDVYRHLETVVPIVDEIRILAREYDIELTTLIPTNLTPDQLCRPAHTRNSRRYLQARRHVPSQIGQPTFVGLNSPKCDRPFTMLRVAMDGSTYMCQGEQPTGLNAFDVDPVDIWNSPRFRELRGQIDRREYDSTCLDCHILRNRLTYEAEFERKRWEPDKLSRLENVLRGSSGNALEPNDAIRGFVEAFVLEDGKVFISGWAVDLKSGRPCTFIIVFLKKVNSLVIRPTERRPDVVQAFSKASVEMCGFSNLGTRTNDPDSIYLDFHVWALDERGCARELKCTRLAPADEFDQTNPQASATNAT
ncbi:MAG: radical SAM protein [Sphingomonadales bacterium]